VSTDQRETFQHKFWRAATEFGVGAATAFAFVAVIVAGAVRAGVL
jgi:hypothetical protein